MGKLRVGMRQMSVRLVDESAGGFALACPKRVVAAPGEVLQLRTSSGLHEVRVIRREEFSDGILLGVERIRDLDDPEPTDYPLESARPAAVALRRGRTKGGGGLRWGWLVGLGLLAGGLLLVGNMLATYRPPQIEARLPGTEKFVDQLAKHAREAAAERQAQREGLRPQKSHDRAGQSDAVGGLSRQWRQAAQRISGTWG